MGLRNQWYKNTMDAKSKFRMKNILYCVQFKLEDEKNYIKFTLGVKKVIHISQSVNICELYVTKQDMF